MSDDNSHLMGNSDGAPDGNSHALRRRLLDREHSLSGVIARLVGLQYAADLEKQITPTRMSPLDVVPYVKGWLISGALVGTIRSDDDTVYKIAASEWDNAKIENCINGKPITARAEPSNKLIEVFGTAEPAPSWDEFAALSQRPERDSPGDEMIALATAQGFTAQAKTVFGRPYFTDRDIERVFGYGWELFTAAPSLDTPATSTVETAHQETAPEPTEILSSDTSDNTRKNKPGPRGEIEAIWRLAEPVLRGDYEDRQPNDWPDFKRMLCAANNNKPQDPRVLENLPHARVKIRYVEWARANDKPLPIEAKGDRFERID